VDDAFDEETGDLEERSPSTAAATATTATTPTITQVIRERNVLIPYEAQSV
jgi:hypothetical protein